MTHYHSINIIGCTSLSLQVRQMTCSHLRSVFFPAALCPPLFQARKSSSTGPSLGYHSIRQPRLLHTMVQASLASSMLSGLKKVLTKVAAFTWLVVLVLSSTTVYCPPQQSYGACAAQDDGPAPLEEGAANFTDNAPTWEALQSLVEQRAKELNWHLPDLEDVSMLVVAGMQRLCCTMLTC